MTICLSYVVITGFIGQVSLIQIALAGVLGLRRVALFKDAGIGFPLAPIAGVARGDVLSASWPAPRRCACAASAWRS